MKSILRIAVASLCLLINLSVHTNLFAQTGNRPISLNEQNEIISKVISLVKSNYVFIQKVPAIEQQLKDKMLSKAYSSSTTLFEFLEAFNKDFETIGKDKHLDVFYSPVEVRQLLTQANSTEQKEEKVNEDFLEFLKYENYGLRTIQRLDGNIGYFKLIHFADISLAKEAFISAMNFISNTGAIIIDLRDNGGGSANSTHFLMNYFLIDSTRLSVFTYRKENRKIDVTVEHEPSVKKLLNTPVYILVNKRTSSAAESVAYTLQALKRATIIGEQTNGEANPGAKFPVDSSLYIMIPTAVNENAVTKTNWEATGVTPDIKLSTDKALIAAQVEAMNVLAVTASSKEMQQFYKWNVVELKAQLNPQEVPARVPEKVVGKYEKGRIVTKENGALYFEATGKIAKAKLTYLMDNTFKVAGRPGLRIKFDLNEDGTAKDLTALWNDDVQQKFAKVKE